jgi:hypothetical protein
MLGVKKAKTALFECLYQSVQIPMAVTFTLWHSFFLIIGILILIWPRPILPLIVVLIVLCSELYINFSLHNPTGSTMLLFVLVLVTLALIIYHSRPQLR